MSNHNTKFIKELYNDKKYYFQKVVSATRNLSRNIKERKAAEIEILVYGGKNVK